MVHIWQVASLLLVSVSCSFEKYFFQSLICNFDTFMIIHHKVLGMGVADVIHLGGLNR